ncbi:MAG: CRISPR-associated ring nuclease Csm6 [Gemmataceae bacterium]|nr:CRISPR-associated ring nuclease Csm6 [Gemmataceae bacterium]MDW8264069.1 CRISPR-associated ring nuclease Csm6 [Gemmataceae bacterium]
MSLDTSLPQVSAGHGALGDRQETVLVATIGTSPAVLTETVWALANRTPSVLVDRVVVITTRKGKADLCSRLLTGDRSPWQRLRHVLGLNTQTNQDKLRLDPSDIHTIVADGQELDDIRTTDDNRAVADQILALLMELRANPNRTVYASLAGGRKTMSSLLLSAMTICAKSQDRVFHVLVNEPFDNPRLNLPFFFPDPAVPYYTLEDKGQTQVVPADQARVELAEIPIPSFSELLEFVPDAQRRQLSLETVPHFIRRGTEEAVTQRLFNRPIDVEDCLSKTPLLKWLGKDKLRARHTTGPKPLSGLHVLMVLHCLTNLVSFTWALQQLGLEKATYFIKEYPYPQKRQIREWLKSQNYDVFDLNEDNLRQELAKWRSATDTFLIIEDGGWITKGIIEQGQSPLLERVVGAIEQTTRGLWRIQESLKVFPVKAQSQLFPILLLPHSRHKREFEPPHIGRGIVRAIDQMIPDYLDSMEVGLFGYGTIGKAVASALVDMGARVTVYDPGYTSRVRQSGHSHVNFAPNEDAAVERKRLIIGCSGNASIDDRVIDMIRDDRREVYLASGSSEKVEINVEALRRMSRKTSEVVHDYLMVEGCFLRLGTKYELPLANVVLLGDGLPINFMGLGGMKDPAADYIMSLMLAGAYKLACREISGHGLVYTQNTSCIDQIVEELEIEEKFNEIMEMG